MLMRALSLSHGSRRFPGIPARPWTGHRKEWFWIGGFPRPVIFMAANPTASAPFVSKFSDILFFTHPFSCLQTLFIVNAPHGVEGRFLRIHPGKDRSFHIPGYFHGGPMLQKPFPYALRTDFTDTGSVFIWIKPVRCRDQPGNRLITSCQGM